VTTYGAFSVAFFIMLARILASLIMFELHLIVT